jgi:hypothetical protein
MKALPYVLAALVVGAGVFAFFRADRPPEPTPRPPQAATAPPDEPSQEPPAAAAVPRDPLPANGPPHGPMGVENEEPAALRWTVPARWEQAPNPNPMRLATYRVDGAGSAGSAEVAEVAEVSVARAGGTPDANIERWVRQFEGASTPKRSEKKVRGVDVTVVEVSGTYGGGAMMMPGAAQAVHPGWTLVGAIAQPPDGSTYFFKLLGPSAQVHAARPSFDAFLDTLTPP